MHPWLLDHARRLEYCDLQLNGQLITPPFHRLQLEQTALLRSLAFCRHCRAWSGYLDRKYRHPVRLRASLISVEPKPDLQSWSIYLRHLCRMTPESHFECVGVSGHHAVAAQLFESVDYLDQLLLFLQAVPTHQPQGEDWVLLPL